MSLEYQRQLEPTPEEESAVQVRARASHDSARGLLKPAKSSDPAMNTSYRYPGVETEEDFPRHGPPPPNSGRRWGPPPSEYGYGYDERDERRYYGRESREYPMRPSPTAVDYYNDGPYYNRPYRRVADTTPTKATYRGHASAPPRHPVRRATFEDPGESDEEEYYPRRPKRRAADDRESAPSLNEVMRLPFTEWMNRSVKHHFVAFMGELVGTTMFLFFAFAGTQVANVGAQTSASTTTNQQTGFSPIVLLYIATAFGFSLMTNVWIFFRISGGLFNPAVTLAMAMVHSISYVRAVLLLIAQLAGSIFASFLVKVIFPTPLNVRTTLSPTTSVVRGVCIEAFLTGELVFAIFMLANEKHKATFMAPIGIGLTLFVAELVGVFYTGGSLNPARSFGPCVVTGQFDPEHWIYWVGPAIGAMIAVGFYQFIKVLEYEMANPGQDESSQEEADAAASTTPVKETATKEIV